MKQIKKKPIRYSRELDLVSHVVREAEIYYDARGRKKKVMLPYRTYEEMKALLDDAYDNTKMDEVATEPSTPYREARKKLFPGKR
jgi:hypothetical protein